MMKKVKATSKERIHWLGNNCMRMFILCDACAGAQSDSEVSPHHPSEVSVDRGYTSDSEVYTEHSKARIPRSLTDMDAASSGWLLVSAKTWIICCGVTNAFEF